MRVLLYESIGNKKSESLVEGIEKEIPHDLVERYHNREALIKGVLDTPNLNDIIVLFCNTRDEFMYFLSMRDLFVQYRIILSIPDRDEGTLKQAHRMYPRYLTYSDSDHEEVCEVLKKMVSYINRTIENTDGSESIIEEMLKDSNRGRNDRVGVYQAVIDNNNYKLKETGS